MTKYNKGAATDPFISTRERFEKLLLKLKDKENEKLEHSELENLIDKEGREILRQALQDLTNPLPVTIDARTTRPPSRRPAPRRPVVNKFQ